MDADDKNIKFPDKHYVGFQTRPDADDLPLGFMTPDGTDSAAKKRKDTVDNWAKGYGYDARNKGSLPAQTYDNKPMSGFKLGRDVRHGYGWGQGNVKWRIEDPRGFELEITSPNLAQILSTCTVENGEILEECKWARLRAENILVPVTSDVYKAAVANTARLNKSAKPSDMKLGDTVILMNGMTGRYMGAYYPIDYQHYDGVAFNYVDRKRHFFEIIEGATSYRADEARYNILIVATPKLSEIKPTATPLTPVDAERELLAMLADPTTSYEGSGNNYVSRPVAVNTKGGKSLKSLLCFDLESVDPAEFVKSDESGNVFIGDGVEWGIAPARAVREHINGTGIGHGRLQMRVYDKAAWDRSKKLVKVTHFVRGYWAGSGSQQHKTSNVTNQLSSVHRVRVTGTTVLGNKIDFYG